jgi:hypothetical protein
MTALRDSTRTFDPWIGSRYTTDGIRGVRLLILGESHYGFPGEMRPTFTADVVRALGQQHRFRFFTVIQRLVTGGSGWLSNDDRSEFWERVAFYNYIQSFPGTRPRWRPTPEMWLAAREPFLQTLSELSPQLLLVLGLELHRNLPELPFRIGVCIVSHPSYPGGFRYAQWQPVVQAALLEAMLPKT